MSTKDALRVLSNDDIYLFGEGNWFRSYEKMGAHFAKVDGKAGYFFAVWAPQVKSVHVIGDFNNWDPCATPLEVTSQGGIWQGFVAGGQEAQRYKYLIESQNGELLKRAERYGVGADINAGNAKKTAGL